MTERRVLVAAPTRRDGEVTRELLARVGIECLVCRELATLASEARAGVGSIVLTDAVLGDPAFTLVSEALREQKAWSDVPVLLLTQDRGQSPVTFGRVFSNVTILDLPSSTRSVVSAVQSALRSRQRQYQIRDQLVTQQRAEDALRAADLRKDEFLAILAHELRNPLAAIRMGLQVVERHPGESARLQRMVGMIDRQSRLLVKLIDDLMDVSRIATGKLVLARDRLDLRSVIETVLEAGQTVLDASSREIRVDLPPDPVWVLGDNARLTQVVGNLFNNAGKYTPEGGRITVSLNREGSEAVIRVMDTGVGIPGELLEHVFDMFAQVDGAVDRAQGGLGIGLSLVRRLVELHGGTVNALSKGADQGSTFTVRLPAVAGADNGIDAPYEGGKLVERHSLGILVIDDNRDVANALTTMLELEGHEVSTAHDGAAGLVEIARFDPDLVFCDIGMPGMTGHEVVRRLRAEKGNSVPMLVALTGWGNEADKIKSAEAGFDVHMTKPVNREQLDAVIATASARQATDFPWRRRNSTSRTS